jgi:hypothetical protein
MLLNIVTSSLLCTRLCIYVVQVALLVARQGVPQGVQQEAVPAGVLALVGRAQ